MLDFLRSFCISLMSTSRNSTLFSRSSTFVLVFSVLSFRFCTSFSKKAKDSSRDAIDLCKLSRRASILSSFCNLFKIMSTFFPRSSAIDSAVITSSSASLVLVERLASLLFFLWGEKTSEEEDLGRSFLFGGIELQRITRQKGEHRRIRPYTSTLPSIPLLLLCSSRWCHCWHCLNSLMA